MEDHVKDWYLPSRKNGKFGWVYDGQKVMPNGMYEGIIDMEKYWEAYLR